MQRIFLISIFIGLSVGLISLMFLTRSSSSQLSSSVLNPLLNGSMFNNSTQKHEEQYSVWLPYWDQERVVDSLKTAAPKLKIIRPFWYRITPEGAITSISTSQKSQITQLAQENKIAIYPTLVNDLDPQRVEKMLSDATKRKEALSEIDRILQRPEYAGIDIDIEGVTEKDKAAFTQFMKDIKALTQKNNKKLSITVHAQNGTYTDWTGSKGQDYRALGAVADEIVIMAYDYHYSGSKPGPVTPINWLKSITDYALKTIPKEKISIGLPMYGYNWSSTRTEGVQFDDVQKIIREKNIQPTRDPESQSVKVEYTDSGNTHTIFIEDSQSTYAKIKAVEEKGIYSFVFWRLGGEDKSFWTDENKLP